MNEKDYEAGYRAAMSRIAQETMRSLPMGDRDKLALLTERQQAIVALRSVCAEFGDNEWPDELHLSDIIEKHLHQKLAYSQRSPHGKLNAVSV